MASTAPVQPAPVQPPQNGNRSPHVNGSQGDQQFKQNGRNPPHKKNYANKQSKEGGGFQGNQDPRGGERPRRHREDNNDGVNGSPQEYRERRERKGRNASTREAPNTNGNGSTPNGNGNGNGNVPNGSHAKPEQGSSSHTEETKGASKDTDAAMEQVQVDGLQAKYPQVPVDKIVRVIRKNGYNSEKSLHDLEALQKQSSSPWIEAVKGKQSKPAQPTPVPVTQQQEHAPRRDKRRENAPDQHQSPQEQQSQQSQQQQQQQQQQQHPSQQRQPRQPQQHYVHPQHQHHQQQHNHQQQQHQAYQQYPQHQNYQQYYQQVHQQAHPQHQELIQQGQQLQEQQLALQPYQPAYPQQEGTAKGEDILHSLSKVIEHELAAVQKRTEMLASLKGQMDLIHNADKENRIQLEEKRIQLEADRQNFTEQLRIVENELATVKHHIKNAEDDKRSKIEDLYRNFQSNGVLAITNS